MYNKITYVVRKILRFWEKLQNHEKNISHTNDFDSTAII